VAAHTRRAPRCPVHPTPPETGRTDQSGPHLDGRQVLGRLPAVHRDPPGPPDRGRQATVKKAMAILKDGGLIETTPGYGTFVRERSQDS
jgi:hypothetical protein